MSRKAYIRRLIVRAIEDAIILGSMVLGIAFICLAASQALAWLGAA